MVRIISIDGNIGSGKSTLLKMLEKSGEFDNTIFVREPVGQWQNVKDKDGVTILSKFYKDTKRYAYCFQELTLMSRFSSVKKAIKASNTETVIIIERSIWTDKFVFAKMLRDSGMIEDIMFKIYNENFKVIEQDFKIDKYIYLGTSPEKCSDRIKKRARSGEAIPIDYLKNCKKYHDDWLLKKENVLAVHSDEEFEADPEVFQRIVDSIKKFI